MYGIIANVKSDRQLRTGAKVWILECNGDAERPVVRGLSKFGKMIVKYCHYKRLENYRAAFIPEQLFEKYSRFYMTFDTKEKAEEIAQSLNEMWSDIRFYSRDGSNLLQDGEPASHAFKKNNL